MRELHVERQVSEQQFADHTKSHEPTTLRALNYHAIHIAFSSLQVKKMVCKLECEHIRWKWAIQNMIYWYRLGGRRWTSWSNPAGAARGTCETRSPHTTTTRLGPDRAHLQGLLHTPHMDEASFLYNNSISLLICSYEILGMQRNNTFI